MATIRDVAEKAGVAPITVSRVINNSGYVSEETRARVEAAVEELQYVPNTLARSLRFKKTRVLALIVTDITNPFWTTVARGVEDIANEHGFNVILCNTDENETKQVEYVNVLLQKRVDGFLLVPAHGTVESVRLIQRQGVPVVVLDRETPGVEVDQVKADSEAGAYQLVQLLLDRGHRKIAILSAPQSISTSAQRIAGYRKALEEAGVPVEPELIFERGFSQQGGYEMTRQALALEPRPTALFAANNFIALGSLRALWEAGLRTPEDMAIVCFDYVPFSAMVDPFHAIASQPAYTMGQQSTKLLLDRLSGDAPPEFQKVIMPVEILGGRASDEGGRGRRPLAGEGVFPVSGLQ
jgi:LacI family transcriptional regulator